MTPMKIKFSVAMVTASLGVVVGDVASATVVMFKLCVVFSPSTTTQSQIAHFDPDDPFR